MASFGNFTNSYQGSPYIQNITTKLQSDPRWANDTIILDFPRDYWPDAAAIVVACDRLGKPIYVANSSWELIFYRNHILESYDQNSTDFWHISMINTIDVTNSTSIIYSNENFTLINDPNQKIILGQGLYDKEKALTPYYFNRIFSKF